MSEGVHRGVLLQELIEGLAIVPEDIVFDGTVNGGGHAQAVVKRLGEKGVFIGVDLDQSALERTRKRLQGAECRVELRKENFRNLDRVLAEVGVEKLTKAYFDLGLSSDQLENSGRGFSFKKDEPLLMTFDDTPEAQALTARDIVNTWEEEHIADVLFGYGEERAARKIAHALVKARQGGSLKTTADLVAVIESVLKRHGKIHPATKTFQALRIAVNDELGSLKEALRKSYEALAGHGRMAFISFHSAEDRIVKNTFRNWAREGKGTVLTKKPLTPTGTERIENTRSRSSKLRIFEKS